MPFKAPPKRKRGNPNWKKGVSGNPKGGGRKAPADLQQAKQLNKIEVERLLNKYCYMSLPLLKSALNDDTRPMIDICVIRILIEAAKKGDYQRLGFIFDRLIGKVTTEIDVKGNLHLNLVDFIAMYEQEEQTHLS